MPPAHLRLPEFFPKETMAEGYRRLWKQVTDSIDEATAVRALVDILIDKEGRAFALGLNPKDAEYCIDLLGRVSRNLPLQSFVVSDGLVRALEAEISKLLRNRFSSSR